jgi:hypothetical protein
VTFEEGLLIQRLPLHLLSNDKAEQRRPIVAVASRRNCRPPSAPAIGSASPLLKYSWTRGSTQCFPKCRSLHVP